MIRSLGAFIFLGLAATMPVQQAAAQDVLGGAIVGGAIASSNPYYYGGPGYYGPGYPAYAGAYGPCGWQRQRFWDGYAWRVRSVRVCY